MTTTTTTPTTKLAVDNAPGSTQVSTAMRQMTSSSIVVQVCMQTLLHQPDIILDQLPFLPGHQQTARQHADNWLKDINPALILAIADIVDFANNWKEYSDPLYELADKLHTNPADPSVKQDLQDGLTDLMNLIIAKQKHVTDTVKALDDFRVNLEGDQRNFAADQQTAEQDILGANGTLTRMNEDLKTFQDNRSKAIGLIAGATAMEVLGGLMILVGAIAEVFTFGVSTALVIGGLAMVGGGIGMTVVGVKALHDAEDNIAKETGEIGKINADLLALTHVDGQIKDLSAAVGTALESVRAMEKGWQVLNADFTELIQDVADTKKANWVKIKLQATGKAWNKMQVDATALQTYGRLDVQVSTDLTNRQN